MQAIGLRFVLITMIALAATAARAQPADPLVQRKSGVRINWTSGLVTADGRGAAGVSDMDTSPASAAIALIKARADARTKLLEALNGIRINTSQRLSDLAADDSAVRDRINAMVAHLPVIEQLQKKQDDGSIAIQLVMSLRGGFAQLVLPAEIRKIESITQVSTTPNAASAKAPETADEKVFSGLIVDARGLLVEPALAPKLVDERLDEVYGPNFSSREHAVQEGIVSYHTDMEQAAADPRVAGDPLVVKAIRTAWPGLCDLVISNVDAAKIRRSSKHLKFLRECRVVIILDPL